MSDLTVSELRRSIRASWVAKGAIPEIQHLTQIYQLRKAALIVAYNKYQANNQRPQLLTRLSSPSPPPLTRVVEIPPPPVCATDAKEVKSVRSSKAPVAILKRPLSPLMQLIKITHSKFDKVAFSRIRRATNRAGGFICKAHITQGYIQDLYDNYGDIDGSRVFFTDDFGFAVTSDDWDIKNKEWNDVEPNSCLFLHLVCAQSNTKHLISYIIDVARKEGKKYVCIASIPSLITYYHNIFGFKSTFKCHQEAKIITSAIADVNAELDALKAISLSSSSSSVSGVSSSFVQTDVTKFESSKKLYKLLSAHNLAVGSYEDPACIDDLDCYGFGFYMKLCL